MAKNTGYLIADYTVFIIFIVGSSLFPLWSKSKSPQTKSNYIFAAGGSASMFAMVLSISRGSLGVRSLLGFPSELFYRGSGMWETLYGIICAFPLVAFIFIPIYFSLGITSVYQYLDLRFKSRLIRCLASATFIFRQVLNMGVTVFTPCVALYTIIGLPYWGSILGITVISIIFTVFGGLGAAVKADIIQSITVIIICLAIIIQCIFEVGIVNIFKVSSEGGRLEFFNFKWDLNERVDTMSAWIGQLFMSVSLYGCQQNFVQRYCSMKSEKKVQMTLLANIPVITILYSLPWIVGMGIYSVYFNCDPLSAGYTEKMDEILPFFMEDKFAYLPGLMGLFLGSLFTGALSLSVSNLNSLATVTWEDFISLVPVFKNITDLQQLTMIKVLGAIYGLIIMGVSFGVGLLSGVIESNMLITSATSGPLLGVFLLAMLVPCATKKGAAAGMIVSHAVILWITAGHLIFGSSEVTMLPLSTEGCVNVTFHQTTAKTEQWFTKYTPSIMIPNNDHSIARDASLSPITPVYTMTYMYYALIGTVITITVGIIVSLITTSTEDDIYDEKLLHPLILKMSKCFPGKPRKYLNTETKFNGSNTIKTNDKSLNNCESGIKNNLDINDFHIKNMSSLNLKPIHVNKS